MNWIKNLRTETGLSLMQLCYWLQIPKSTLAMAESNQRDLPTPTHLKLAGLLVAMENAGVKAKAAAQPAAPPKDRQLEALHKKLTRQASNLRFKSVTLKRRISEWENRQAQRQHMRLLLAALAHVHENSIPAENDDRWLQRRQEELQAGEARENRFEKQYLLLQLEMLETEAAKLEELAEGVRVPAQSLVIGQ